MTLSTPPIPDDELESRLADALHALADAHVPAESHGSSKPSFELARPSSPEQRQSARTGWLAIAAAVLAVGCLAALIALRTARDSPADDPLVTVPTPTLAGVVGVVGPESGAGPGELGAEAFRWVYSDPAHLDRSAARRAADGSLEGRLSWVNGYAREWDDVWADRPPVEFASPLDIRTSEWPNGLTAFAVRTDRGVFTAAFTPGLEADIAAWMAANAELPAAERTPPAGFLALPSITEVRFVQYDRPTSGVPLSVTTYRLDGPVDLDLWIDARNGDAHRTKLADGVVLVEQVDPVAPVEGSSLLWTPASDTVVVVAALTDEEERGVAVLTDLVDDLSLVLVDDASLDRRQTPIPGVAELELFGETSYGRFAVVQTRQDAGRCTWIAVAGVTSTSQCRPLDDTGPACGLWTDLTDTPTVMAFAPNDAATIEATVRGEPAEPHVERGQTDGTTWTIAWLVGTSLSAVDGFEIDLIVDGQSCLT
jgi:hypothetical protein